MVRWMIQTVAISFSADTRKITALTVVIARTKEYTSAVTMAGLTSGSTMRRSVREVEARSTDDASSRLRSSWLKAAAPERTPTGRLRNTKQITRMAAVPVISSGGTL